MTGDLSPGDGALAPEYFADLYARSDDPWGFTSRWYEERKYALTLACLPRRRVVRALEVGCSLGVLTAALAARCDALVAVDVSERALELAAARVPASVELRRCLVPGEWPEGAFDLVVLSEVGYYLDADGLARLRDRVSGCLAPGGALVAVHWRHPVADYPLSGDSVHHVLRGLPDAVRTVSHVEDDLLLDVLVRPGTDEDPGRLSVGRREGLA